MSSRGSVSHSDIHKWHAHVYTSSPSVPGIHSPFALPAIAASLHSYIDIFVPRRPCALAHLYLHNWNQYQSWNANWNDFLSPGTHWLRFCIASRTHGDAQMVWSPKIYGAVWAWLDVSADRAIPNGITSEKALMQIHKMLGNTWGLWKLLTFIIGLSAELWELLIFVYRICMIQVRKRIIRCMFLTPLELKEFRTGV